MITPPADRDGELVATIAQSAQLQTRVMRRQLRGEWRVWFWDWERSGDRDWHPAKDARGREKFYVVPQCAWSALAAILARVIAEHGDPFVVDAMTVLENMVERGDRLDMDR